MRKLLLVLTSTLMAASAVLATPVVTEVAPLAAQQLPDEVPPVPEVPLDIDETEGTISGGVLPPEEAPAEEPKIADTRGIEIEDQGRVVPFRTPPILSPQTVSIVGRAPTPLGKDTVRVVRSLEDERIGVTLEVLDEELTDRLSPVGGLAFELTTESEGAKDSEADGWELRFSMSLFAESLIDVRRLGFVVRYGCNGEGVCDDREFVLGRVDQQTNELVVVIPTRAMTEIAADRVSDPDEEARELENMSGGTQVFFSAASGTSGQHGSFSASELSVLSSWQVGLQTGHLELGYSIPVPPAVGPSPSLSYSYSSGSVDGMNSSTNNQASQIGLGWSDNAPVISRTLRGCSNGSANEIAYAGNMCLPNSNEGGVVPVINNRHDGFVLSLNGVGGQLVRTTASLTGLDYDNQPNGPKYWEYELEMKNDWRIRRVEDVNASAGLGNGDVFTTFWEVTTGDGTLHVFGRERQFAPQGGSGPWTTRPRVATAADLEGTRTSLQSARVVPVWMGAINSQPNVNGKDITCVQSMCDLAVEWRLDQAIDTDGNMATYHYWQEPNWYNPNGQVREYERALNLWYIDYGVRYADGAYGYDEASQVPFRTRFDYKWRNFQTDVNGNNDGGDIGSGQNWQDTPVDLLCDYNMAVAQGCADTPAFFTQTALKKVTNMVSGADGVRHIFQHSYPIAPESYPANSPLISEPKLWFQAVQQSGPDGTTLPKTMFDEDEGRWHENRVNHNDNGAGGVPAMRMLRVGRMRNALGGTIDYSYAQSHPPTTSGACSRGTNSPGYIRLPCDMFIAYDAFTGGGGAVLWNKWKVNQAVAYPRNGGSDPETYDYIYETPPDWAYSYAVGRGPNYAPQCRNGHGCGYWNDYRGHPEVSVERADGKKTTHFFATGMRNDRVGPNSTTTLGASSAHQNVKPAKYENADGGLNDNWLPLAGKDVGVRNLNASNQLLSVSVVGYSQTKVTDIAYPDSYRITQRRDFNHELNTPGVRSSAHTTQVHTEFDVLGRPFRVQDWGYLHTTSDDRTSFTSYVVPEYKLSSYDNDAWVVSPVQLEAIKSDITTDGSWGNWISADIYNYDNHSYDTEPTYGRLTMARVQVTRTGSGSPVFGDQTNYTHTYRGQVATEKHLGTLSNPADDQQTVFAYHSTYAYLTSVNGPLDNDTTAYTRKAEFGTPLVTTAPNNLVTVATYDGLGRTKTVKLPGVSNPSYKFSYYTHEFHADSVKTETIGDGSSYTASWIYTDGFGRFIQSHNEHQGQNWANVTAAKYDANGRSNSKHNQSSTHH